MNYHWVAQFLFYVKGVFGMNGRDNFIIIERQSWDSHVLCAIVQYGTHILRTVLCNNGKGGSFTDLSFSLRRRHRPPCVTCCTYCTCTTILVKPCVFMRNSPFLKSCTIWESSCIIVIGYSTVLPFQGYWMILRILRMTGNKSFRLQMATKHCGVEAIVLWSLFELVEK